MNDEPQTSPQDPPSSGQGPKEDQGVPVGTSVESGHWKAIEIPPGHYLKDGQLYWDFNDPYYIECQPQNEAPRAS